MRRQALGPRACSPTRPAAIHDHLLLRPARARCTPDGDLVIEIAPLARADVRRMRAEPPGAGLPGDLGRMQGAIDNFMMPGGMGGMGGGLALNQLLVVMDGIDDPPLLKRFVTNRAQHLPRRAVLRAAEDRPRPLRMKPPKPRKEEIYFIGACNVPLEIARPGAHPPGPHGPPHLLPHAHVGGPARHLRPLHQEGRARPGARHADASATSSRASPTATRRR